ncbi:malate synthase A [Chloroflexus sp.]|uniref:malate synthase A n=1 Tax=Chloroflexus sp. TaxID=1904827 RepID=UPI002ACE03AC|nr:malate synthase A [Chloroflexus sp.]
MTAPQLPAGVTITAPITPEYAEILTPEALEFLATLHRRFNARRLELLARRADRQRAIDAGERPDFLPETAHIRESDWTIAPFPAQLNDRRVEITGPVDRKMIINALNSGAKVFMADFEDANTPTWQNQIEGQINLRDALRRTITYTSPEGKHYALNNNPAILFVRPRGWHLPEKHMLVDGEPMSGAIFDFGLYFFHNAQTAIDVQGGPYFYLPKMESHLEARLWNDIFVLAQELRGIPRGTIKATVLIETILAAFEMDEILYELREHSAGLNCGRWDYIFSCIKKFRNDPNFCLADRALVTMTTHFMRSYSLLAIKTCHRRGAHAMGGMAAQIPIKNDPVANEAALAKVRADKEREATDGHDGTWVAHPGLVPVAMEVFDRLMPTPNQISRQRDDVQVTAADLLAFGPSEPITEQGMRLNINVGIQYLGAWLAGNGCVPVFNLMEDAATAEISRAQIWQWIRSPKGVLNDGRKVTVELFRQMLPEELAKVREILGPAYDDGRYEEAAELFDEITTDPNFVEFLTLPAYDRIP